MYEILAKLKSQCLNLTYTFSKRRLCHVNIEDYLKTIHLHWRAFLTYFFENHKNTEQCALGIRWYSISHLCFKMYLNLAVLFSHLLAFVLAGELYILSDI